MWRLRCCRCDEAMNQEGGEGSSRADRSHRTERLSKSHRAWSRAFLSKLRLLLRIGLLAPALVFSSSRASPQWQLRSVRDAVHGPQTEAAGCAWLQTNDRCCESAMHRPERGARRRVTSDSICSIQEMEQECVSYVSLAFMRLLSLLLPPLLRLSAPSLVPSRLWLRSACLRLLSVAYHQEMHRTA